MIQDEIRKLEEQLASSAVRVSAEALDGLISDHFVEFGSSGRVYSKREVIAEMLAKPHITVSLTDFRILAIAQDAALVTYRTGGSLRSSVWRREDEHWRIIFHQGTPIITNS